MNLTITPNFQIYRQNQAKHQNKSVQYPQLQPLNADTVSFSGKLPREASVIGQAIEQAYISRVDKFIDYAKDFHRGLKNACEKLADEGFCYDEVYNSKHPIKTLDSFMDKYERQGYVQDIVRGTVYWTDQQNVGSFKKFLDAMKEEGYEIAVFKTLNPKTGRFEKHPDLEIRQNGITPDDLEILGSFLKKAEISKPRSSTYSDYQMRFVPINKKGKNENKQTLELIMLYGPHYSKAKELESKYVYNITRTLGKLHINFKENYPEKSPGRRIANNLDVIKTRLREDISRPLFTNAYNADAKICGEEKLPVVIGKEHVKMLDGYMSGVRQKIPLYYKEARQKYKPDEFITELIKRSPDYLKREDKTITQAEIKRLRKFYMDRLSDFESDDIGIIAKAQDLLKETLKKFGEKTVNLE